MTLVVIPVRRDVRNASQLRYAVRAWVEHCPDAEFVLIGGRPAWWGGEHVPTEQRAGRAAQWAHNFPAAMRAATRLESGPFWWAADDIFPLAPVPADPPTWCRLGDLDQHLDEWGQQRITGSYTRLFLSGMTGQRDILRAAGVTTQHNADMHMPHRVSGHLLADLLSLFDTQFPEHPAGHWRAVYGGLWPGRVERVADPKVFPGERVGWQGRTWLSTSAASWRQPCGAAMKLQFPDPSPYEKDAA